ncbi:MAG: cofactor-independent phosphoglycerate mutase [Candidatus Ratteibacteria bacterium]|nr:cofactor-independent phosphoglycerate mutase [Candidatus Ratteibacteria bacterium]
MKYIILIMDGAADRPLRQLGGKTPLCVAKKEHIDYLAERGRCGLFKTIPENFSTCSGVANLSILGYDPLKYFQGRGVLEAAAMGIQLEDTDVAFRCNTICITEDGKIKNHSAGHISSEEAEVLIEEANKKIGSDKVVFYPGVSYRHLLVLKGGYSPDVECFPPHDYVGHPYKELLVKPKNTEAVRTAELLNNLIEDSREFLERHPVNTKRKKEGKDIANMLWPWSPGKRPQMELFSERFGIKGAVVSAVDLIKGIGIYCGFDVIEVKGATGLYNTNYEGKADACVDALNGYDLVYVHVEATDEAGHEGNLKLKIQCIEDFDKRLVGNILPRIDIKNTVIAVLPDHYTPVETGAHSSEPVPFLIYHPLLPPDNVKSFDEESCSSGVYGLCEGDDFINLVIGRR